MQRQGSVRLQCPRGERTGQQEQLPVAPLQPHVQPQRPRPGPPWLQLPSDAPQLPQPLPVQWLLQLRGPQLRRQRMLLQQPEGGQRQLQQPGRAQQAPRRKQLVALTQERKRAQKHKPKCPLARPQMQTALATMRQWQRQMQSQGYGWRQKWRQQIEQLRQLPAERADKPKRLRMRMHVHLRHLHSTRVPRGAQRRQQTPEQNRPTRRKQLRRKRHAHQQAM